MRPSDVCFSGNAASAVVELRKRIADQAGDQSIRPTELAKQIRSQAKQLAESLKKVAAGNFLSAVDKVKDRDKLQAIAELEGALHDFAEVTRQPDKTTKRLNAAISRLKERTRRAGPTLIQEYPPHRLHFG